MRKKIIIRVMTFIGIFVLLFLGITELFKAKWIYCYEDNIKPATLIVDGFYENKDELDVVFVGSSNAYENINPLVLFEDFGISGYVFATASQTMTQTYSFTKEAIRVKQPKVIVLDVYALKYRSGPREDRARISIDYLPFSLNKLELINNVVSNDAKQSFSDYLFPIKRYHSRWSELTKDDYTYPLGEKHYTYRGYQAHFNTVPCKGLKYNEKLEFSGFAESAEKYFVKIIQLCERTNTPLVLIKSPNVNWNKAHSEEVTKIIQDYDVEFLDYAKDYKEIGISLKDCFRDTGRHFNYKGAKIYTDAIGQYLEINYQLDDRRDEEEFAYVYDDLAIYYQDIESAKLEQMKDGKQILDTVNGNENYNVYYNVNLVDLMKFDSNFYELLTQKGIDLTADTSGKNIINGENLNDSFLGNQGINIQIYDILTQRVVSNFSVSKKLVIAREKKEVKKSDL